jgi:hypothetical protein
VQESHIGCAAPEAAPKQAHEADGENEFFTVLQVPAGHQQSGMSSMMSLSIIVIIVRKVVEQATCVCLAVQVSSSADKTKG